jgi:hypothetical protein
MIGKIQADQIRELLEALSAKQPDAESAVTNNDADVSVQVNHASLINQAMQVTETDDDIVNAARKLLRSGQLESPDKVREGAENIVAFGI